MCCAASAHTRSICTYTPALKYYTGAAPAARHLPEQTGPGSQCICFHSKWLRHVPKCCPHHGQALPTPSLHRDPGSFSWPPPQSQSIPGTSPVTTSFCSLFAAASEGNDTWTPAPTIPISSSKPFCTGYQWILQLHIPEAFSSTRSIPLLQPAGSGTRGRAGQPGTWELLECRDIDRVPEHGNQLSTGPRKCCPSEQL